MKIEIEMVEKNGMEWYTITINGKSLLNLYHSKQLFYKSEVHTIIQKYLFKSGFTADYTPNYEV